MASKILCAGFSKEEKAAVEAEVKPVTAARPSDESWTISLVKTGTRLAVTVDGPDDRLRAKNFVAELWELRQKLIDLLTNNGFPPAAIPAAPPVAAKPAASTKAPAFGKAVPTPSRPAPAPAKPAPPAAKPAPSAFKAPAPAPKSSPSRPAAASAPITPAPQPRVAAPLTPPPSRIVSTPPAPSSHPDEEYDWESPHATGERREAHECGKCKRRYAVVYEALPNEPRYTVAVACPHCWDIGHLEIGENAALSKQYRADKLKD
jgi:hypothetical protein